MSIASFFGTPIISCCCRSHLIPLNTWRNNDVVITSKRRHFDVITSKWRRCDVITTSLSRDVSAGMSQTEDKPGVQWFVYWYGNNMDHSIDISIHTCWNTDDKTPLIILRQRSCEWYTGLTLSVRPSVCLTVRSVSSTILVGPSSYSTSHHSSHFGTCSVLRF